MTLLRAQVEENPCQTIEELSNSLNQPWSTIQEYLQQIGKLNRAEPFFDRLITVDEKWVLYDDPKNKRSWLYLKEPPRRTAKPGLHTKKALLCVWWGIRGIVHFEVLKPGETVNAELYCEQLDRLKQSLIERYPAVINRKGVIFQHDNARRHCTRKTAEKLMDWGGWYCLTLHTHLALRQRIPPTLFTNKKFQNLNDIKNAISRYFTEKPIVFYRSGIENLHTRWQKVFANEGDYIID
ncbi:histone-lysine N-methyltransferase SETMAR [Trichonephila clavipes]|nr:histone-lysine N-methyltransferase SETMAR [Trichonephila clavipes]